MRNVLILSLCQAALAACQATTPRVGINDNGDTIQGYYCSDGPSPIELLRPDSPACWTGLKFQRGEFFGPNDVSNTTSGARINMNGTDMILRPELIVKAKLSNASGTEIASRLFSAHLTSGNDYVLDSPHEADAWILANIGSGAYLQIITDEFQATPHEGINTLSTTVYFNNVQLGHVSRSVTVYNPCSPGYSGYQNEICNPGF